MIEVTVVALVFHDAISRTLLQHLASLEAKFEGEFDLNPAFPFTLDATAVSLAFEEKPLAGS